MSIISGADWDSGQLNEDFPREVQWDDFGIATGTCHFNCVFAAGANVIGAEKTHPDFDFLIRKNAVLRRVGGGLGTAVINYWGVEANLESSTYSLEATASLQPIETHPKFKSDIGGYGALGDADYPQHTKHSARFDKDGKFLGFGTTETSNTGEKTENPFSGVRSYYAPSVVYKESTLCGENHVAVMLDKLGQIDVPSQPDEENQMPSLLPNTDAIGGFGSEIRNFLLLGVDATPIGKGSRRNKRWMLSGPRGWNQLIYTRGSNGINVDSADL